MRAGEFLAVDDAGFDKELLGSRDRLDHRFHFGLEVVRLIDHISDRLDILRADLCSVSHFMEYPEESIRIDASECEVVICVLLSLK